MHVCGRAVEGPELGTWPPNSSRNHRPGWYRGGENGRRDARHSWLGGAGRLQVASGERRTVSMCHGPELHVVCSCRVMRGWAKIKQTRPGKKQLLPTSVSWMFQLSQIGFLRRHFWNGSTRSVHHAIYGTFFVATLCELFLFQGFAVYPAGCFTTYVRIT